MLPAGWGATALEPRSGLAAWMREAESLLAEARALQGRLGALSSLHAGPGPGLETWRRERAALRSGLEASRSRLAAAALAHDRLAAVGVRPADGSENLGGGEADAFRRAIPPELRLLLDAGRLRHAIAPALEGIRDGLERESAAWEAAERAAARGRLLRRAGPWVAAAALLLGGLGLASLVLPAPVGPGPAPSPAPAAFPAAAAAAEEFRPGDLVGGSFTVVRLLGRGNLGAVYEALDGQGRRVALKRIREEAHRREGDVARLLAEARRAADLRHPHIAEVRAVFLERERIVLAVEHVPGRSLGKLLQDEGPLPLPALRNVLSQAAAAVDHAHEQGTLHGDLKPANLLLGSDGALKVTDFGLALAARRLLSEGSWSPSASPYWAPEAELGPPGPRSDVYSLGTVLYELATGRRPFSGPDPLADKRAGRYPAPSSIEARLPKGFDALVHLALEPDPERRTPTASDLFAALLELPG